MEEIGVLANSAKDLLDRELDYYNATSLRKELDTVIDGLFSNKTVTPVFTWTAKRIAIFVGSFGAAGICLALGTLIILGIVFARKKLTGYDALIMNHLFIDMMMGVLWIPSALVVKFVYDGAWQNSVDHCFAWGYFRGLVHKATGISLTVLSLHQLGSLLSQLQSMRGPPTVSFRSRDRLLFGIYLVVLVCVVWIVSFAAETTIFEMEAGIFDGRCGITADWKVIQRFVLSEEVVAIWIPTHVTAFSLIFVLLFFLICRAKFQAMTATDQPKHLVFYSPQTSVDLSSDNVRLLESRGSYDSGVMDQDYRIFFENQLQVTKPETKDGEKSVTPQAAVQPVEDLAADREFSLDSLSAWAALAFSHFIFVVPSHILHLAGKDAEPYSEEYNERTLIVSLVMGLIKVALVDFLALLVAERYRNCLATSRRRFCR